MAIQANSTPCSCARNLDGSGFYENAFYEYTYLMYYYLCIIIIMFIDIIMIMFYFLIYHNSLRASLDMLDIIFAS